MKLIPQEEALNYDKVFVITFYNGYIEGHKYNIESIDTKYSSFVASYGTKFYQSPKDAKKDCKALNDGTIEL